MEILQVVGIGLIAAVLLTLLRHQRSELAVQLSIVVSIILFLFVLTKMTAIVRVLEEIANRVSLNQFYLTTLLKILGIAFIAEFGAQICRDAGESAVAGKVEMAAKVLVLVLALPIIVALMDSFISLLPGGGG